MSANYHVTKPLHAILMISGLMGFLSACTSSNTGNGVAGGDDATIKQSILTLWQQDHPDAAAGPAVAVSDGTVILTGTLSTPQMQIDAVREAWQPNGVKEVVNELSAPQSQGISYKKDTSLTIKLRARLTFDSTIASTNYAIQTVDGVIYLMGIAQNEEELAKVTQLAYGIGATKVVSYVRVKKA